MQSKENRLLQGEWMGKIFSNGWRQGRGECTAVMEPASGQVLTTAGTANAQDVSDAVSRAADAQAAWAAMLAPARAAILRRCADVLVENLNEIKLWLVRETGSVHAKAEWEIRGAAADFLNASALLSEPAGSLLSPRNPGQWSLARRVALGVVGVITPWNSPLVLASRVVAPALAMGNAVVLKPDVHTPVSGGAVLASALNEAGLPEGLLHVLVGGAEAGEALCTEPGVAKLSFTGSTATGRKVGALAGRHLKRATLELGGNNPFILLPDADVEIAARAAAFGSYFHQGQICFSIGRHLVHESLHDAYVEALRKQATALHVGNPVDARVQVGPLINQRQLDRVRRIVDASVAQGAQRLCGGESQGLFYEPTVLARVAESMPAFQEEIFGPVAAVTPFRSTDEAIRLANASEYGLVAAIQAGGWEQGLGVANALRVGIVHINDQTIVRGGDAPVGGEGSSGNGGRAGHLVNADEWSAWQWMTMRAPGGDYEW